MERQLSKRSKQARGDKRGPRKHKNRSKDD